MFLQNYARLCHQPQNKESLCFPDERPHVMRDSLGYLSLHAAAHPENTDFLYFVADGKGGHNFAKTLDAHNRNVRQYRQIIRKNKASAE